MLQRIEELQQLSQGGEALMQALRETWSSLRDQALAQDVNEFLQRYEGVLAPELLNEMRQRLG